MYLKYENQQKTGSFKGRGAYNKIMKRFLEGDLPAVVASSAGNHAQGVAFAAASVGVPATIVMPRSCPELPKSQLPKAMVHRSFCTVLSMMKPMPRRRKSQRKPVQS